MSVVDLPLWFDDVDECERDLDLLLDVEWERDLLRDGV